MRNPGELIDYIYDESPEETTYEEEPEAQALQGASPRSGISRSGSLLGLGSESCVCGDFFSALVVVS